ncbi:MAG: MATE family efflux transporter [Clostridium sp.]
MKKVDILKDDINSLIVRYMIPSVAGMLGLSLCIFLDTFFIGRGVGNLGLAALNIGIPVYSLFSCIGLLFGVGGATALSVSIGKKNYSAANKIFTFSIISTFIIGIIITLFGTIFLEDIAWTLGATENTIELVKEYVGVLMVMALGFVMASVLNVFVRNDGNPKLSMWAVIAANLTNIVLDYIFIIPMGMGMRGAAIATSLAQIVAIIILLMHFILKKNNIKFVFTMDVFNYAHRIVSNGLPSLVLEISAGALIFIFNIVVGKISGDIGLSAYSIISNSALIVVAILNGIAQGIQPILSVNYGAENLERVLETYKKAKIVAFTVGAISFGIALAKPSMIVSIFSSSKGELLDITVLGLRLYFIAFLAMGINIVNVGFLQSIEKSKISTILSVLRGIVLVLIIISLFAYFLGLKGVWMTIPVVETITIGISTILIKRDEEIYFKSKS